MAARKKSKKAEHFEPPSFEETKETTEDALADVAKRFSHWRPAREELTKVLVVPTIFPQYDRATRVGGHPIQRVALVHGPSSHGKTTFAHGIGASFLKRGHFEGFIDAEMTTPIDWVEKLAGDLTKSPRFFALRPGTYEEVVDSVREFANTIVALREEEKVPPDTSGIAILDSLRKLIPKNVLAKILKDDADSAKGSIDGMGGRAAQIRAALNAAWLDEAIPLLNKTKTALLIIARETDDPMADQNDRKYGNDWKVGGGKAPFYESSLAVRITASELWEAGENGTRGRMVGTRHCGTIHKTKLAAKDSEHARFYFHTSNGAVCPEGFDRPRDVIELAKRYEILKISGSWFSWKGHRWQGADRLHLALHEKPEMLDELEKTCRDLFSPDEKLDEPEHDSDGVLKEVFE
jgi:recombination protein RecA